MIFPPPKKIRLSFHLDSLIFLLSSCEATVHVRFPACPPVQVRTGMISRASAGRFGCIENHAGQNEIQMTCINSPALLDYGQFLFRVMSAKKINHCCQSVFMVHFFSIFKRLICNYRSSFSHICFIKRNCVLYRIVFVCC